MKRRLETQRWLRERRANGEILLSLQIANEQTEWCDEREWIIHAPMFGWLVGNSTEWRNNTITRRRLVQDRLQTIRRCTFPAVQHVALEAKMTQNYRERLFRHCSNTTGQHKDPTVSPICIPTPSAACNNLMFHSVHCVRNCGQTCH